jgi:HD superfamily phosphohydrolase YqeK
MESETANGQNEILSRLNQEVIPIYDRFDPDFYAEHIMPVTAFSKLLANRTNRDPFIPNLSAALHDIGLALTDPEMHHITGAEESRRILSGLCCSAEIQERVSQAILNHNCPFSSELSLDDELLRSADGMAHIAHVPYTFHSFLLRYSYEEAKKKTIQRLEEDLAEKITLPIAKTIIAPIYRDALVFLND